MASATVSDDSFLMTPDYHMHTPLCRHASGRPVEFARRGADLGLPEIGFSDHSPMPSPFDDWRMLLEEFPNYLEEVEYARAEVPSLPIRLSLEVDYFPDGHEWIEELSGMASWDYLIGSVHYIKEEGVRWDIDNPEKELRYVASAGATEEIWARYWETYIAAIRSGLFDLMGHPDLPKKFGHRPQGDLRRFYEPAIEAALEMNVAIELNTAGWHKTAAEQYPAFEFLKLQAEAGIPLSISSDAHAPEEVGRDFPKAIALAKGAGFSETVRFAQRKRSTVPFAIA